MVTEQTEPAELLQSESQDQTYKAFRNTADIRMIDATELALATISRKATSLGPDRAYQSIIQGDKYNIYY